MKKKTYKKVNCNSLENANTQGESESESKGRKMRLHPFLVHENISIGTAAHIFGDRLPSCSKKSTFILPFDFHPVNFIAFGQNSSLLPFSSLCTKKNKKKKTSLRAHDSRTHEYGANLLSAKSNRETKIFLYIR